MHAIMGRWFPPETRWGAADPQTWSKAALVTYFDELGLEPSIMVTVDVDYGLEITTQTPCDCAFKRGKVRQQSQMLVLDAHLLDLDRVAQSMLAAFFSNASVHGVPVND